MININGIQYYTAKEICPILQMAYPSVIHLLQINRIDKFENKYIITQEQLIKLKERKNQNVKGFMFTLKTLSN